ncbi:MAG: IPT/TIG domain-containing protein, partial [Thermoanaerobaculia bacterium]
MSSTKEADATVRAGARVRARVLRAFCALLVASSGILVAGVNSWTPIGPEGAQVRILAIDPTDPSTAYAATVAAGVFKTIDSGASWSWLDIRYDNGDRLWNVRGFALDPANPQTLYVGSVGALFKSTDGGASWTEKPGPSFANVLVVDPGTPTRVYAGTYYGLYRSEDGGETFEKLYPLSFPYLFEVEAIAISPVDRGVIYAGNSGGLVKSVDDGLEFDPIFVAASSLAIDPSQPNTVYAATGSDVAIQKSVDEGDNWNPIEVGLEDQFVSAIVVDPSTPETLYVSTEAGGVFKTTDGGDQWNAASGGTISLFLSTLAIDPQNPAILWAGATGAGVFRSLDSAGTWNPFNSGLTGARVEVLETHPLAPGKIFGGAIGLGLLETSNLGQNWEQSTTGFDRVPIFSDLALAPTNPNLIWAAVFGGVYQSTDGGDGFVKKAPPGYLRFDSLAIDPTDPSTLYTSAYSGGGSTFKTVNGGGLWTPINDGLAPEVVTTVLKQMVIDPSDPSTIYGASENYGMFKTVDGGDHWTPINAGLSGFGVTAVALGPGPSPVLYTATQEGFYGSTDGGTSWDLVGVLPLIFPPDHIVVQPTDPSMLYATQGLYGGGIVRSGDGGIHWNSMNPGLVNHTVSSFAVDTADPSILYAGVDGAGVWVMTMTPISVEGITPDSGPASGGTEIAVAGTALADEAAVRVGGVDSPSVTFVSAVLLEATAPAVTAGTVNDVQVVNANGTSATLSAAWFADFLDVDAGSIYHDDVESIVRAGITAGCGGGNYCVAVPVSRA